MNYLDLFSGCGGFRRGLEEAGFTFEWEGHSEIDKYAKQVYEKHYPQSEDLGDVRTVRIDGMPKIDLITFGFPCQDLSIAGKRGGLEASRSGLFFEAMRIVRDAKPDYFIFENVKGLFSSRGGLDWLNVLREVTDSGYDGQWQLLNTRWFLPQNRERIYFVGHPRGTSRPQIFPVGESDGNDGVSLGIKRIAHGNKFRRWNQTYDKGGIVECLDTPSGGGSQPCIEVKRHPLKFIERNQKNMDGDYAFTIDSANTGGVYITNPKMLNSKPNYNESVAITATSYKEPPVVSGIRRLTPTECERLQGFPDGWTEGQSDTQRYKMMGNAVTVNVVKAVVEKLK